LAGGSEGVQVDGNDIIAMRDAMDRALDKARKGGGPTLIEAMTYRLSDHTTADDARRDRKQEEVQEAQLKEPMIRIRKWLMDKKGWSEKDEDALLAVAAEQVDEAVQAYLARVKPPIASMFDHVLADMPPPLAEQREMALEEAKNHG